MIKRTLMIIGLLSMVLMQCKILSFDPKPLVLDMTIEETYHLTSSQTSNTKSETVNLASIFGDSGIEPGTIEDVTIKNITVLITDNHSTATTVTSLNVSFAPLGGGPHTLASASNLNLSTVLNVPLNPFSATFPITVNTEGISALEAALMTDPPPSLVFTMQVTLNGAPVDLTATVTVAFQVKYQP